MPRAASRPLEWVKPPQQLRSHKTLERLLDAAEELMIERGYDGTTIADVARRGGSSVGAFYARFADKDALLRCLLSRFVEQAVATSNAAFEPARWDGMTIEEVFRVGFAFVVEMYRRRTRLVAAFARLLDRDAHRIQEEIADAVTSGLLRLLESRGAHIGHPDPEHAVSFAAYFVLGGLNGRAIQLASGAPARHRDADLARELTTMCLAYLNISNR
jgi:AcrR family transcriptional regulator